MGLTVLRISGNIYLGPLVFRRANGAVVGKKEFLTGLVKGNPFATRISDQISVNVVGDRALVTLIVVGTRADDNSIHHYRNIRFFSRPAGEWLVDGWYNYEVTGV